MQPLFSCVILDTANVAAAIGSLSLFHKCITFRISNLGISILHADDEQKNIFILTLNASDLLEYNYNATLEGSEEEELKAGEEPPMYITILVEDLINPLKIIRKNKLSLMIPLDESTDQPTEIQISSENGVIPIAIVATESIAVCPIQTYPNPPVKIQLGAFCSYCKELLTLKTVHMELSIYEAGAKCIGKKECGDKTKKNSWGRIEGDVLASLILPKVHIQSIMKMNGLADTAILRLYVSNESDYITIQAPIGLSGSYSIMINMAGSEEEEAGREE